jgi:hypothetical protein
MPDTTRPTATGPAGVSEVAEITPQRPAATTRLATSGIAARAGTKEGRSAESFDEIIAAAGSPIEEAQACLAAARHKLVNQCAPLLTMNCRGTLQAEQADLLGRRAAEGLEHLERVSRIQRLLADSVEADVLVQLEVRTDLLRAFGDMFAALAWDPDDEASHLGLLNACNHLAIYLDEENAKLVESAKLWLGVAYRRAGRPERSLQVLRPTLTMPADPRIGLLARLQRCLALGDRGNHVAGIALCLRLGARVEAWFGTETPATRKLAVDTVRFARIELLRGWAAKLEVQGQDEQAKAIAARADELIGSEAYPPSADCCLHLAESIAGLPDWSPEPLPSATREPPGPIDPDED